MITVTSAGLATYLALLSLPLTIATLALLWLARRLGYRPGWIGNLAVVAVVMAIAMIVHAVTTTSDMQSFVTLTLLFFGLSAPGWAGLTLLYSWLVSRGAR